MSRRPQSPRRISNAKTNEPVRLNKYLAECGIASRRGADALIEAGQVTVNRRKVFELGIKIDPKNDEIAVKGRRVQPETHVVYLAFHKPHSVLTSTRDPQGRPTVIDYMSKLPFRVFPVGRLDWDTEGLLLLTNDGEFSHKVAHPQSEVTKTYLAKLNGHPTDEKLQKLLKGVSIIGGRVAAKHIERFSQGSDKYDWVKIVISEGKNRQVRQMFAKIGFDVLKLQRVAIGQLRLGTLRKGFYKVLTPQQLEKIFIPDLPGVDSKKAKAGDKLNELPVRKAERIQRSSSQKVKTTPSKKKRSHSKAKTSAKTKGPPRTKPQ